MLAYQAYIVKIMRAESTGRIQKMFSPKKGFGSMTDDLRPTNRDSAASDRDGEINSVEGRQPQYDESWTGRAMETLGRLRSVRIIKPQLSSLVWATNNPVSMALLRDSDGSK